VFVCSPGCGICFLAQIYGFIPREIALIALISAGKTGHAIDQTLGVGMPTILQYCGRIHGNIGTRSRSELVYGRYAKGGEERFSVNPVFPRRDRLQGVSRLGIQIVP
jgi:DNA-binding CsgD family transcriptional regulator